MSVSPVICGRIEQRSDGTDDGSAYAGQVAVHLARRWVNDGTKCTCSQWIVYVYVYVCVSVCLCHMTCMCLCVCVTWLVCDTYTYTGHVTQTHRLLYVCLCHMTCICLYVCVSVSDDLYVSVCLCVCVTWPVCVCVYVCLCHMTCICLCVCVTWPVSKNQSKSEFI